jgi:hypothetical protein
MILILVLPPPAISQCLPQNVPRGFELANYGRAWKAWSNRDRLIYLRGFVDGQNHTSMSLQNDLPADRRDRLVQQTFTFYKSDALVEVMTSLYSDPANTFITPAAMLYIARDKLAGKDIEALLRSARKSNCGAVETGR